MWRLCYSAGNDETIGSPTTWLSRIAYNPHISDLTLALHEVVLEEAPDAIESISRGYALAIGFSFTGKPLKMGFVTS